MVYIDAKDLVKRYGGGEAQVEALRGMSFTIAPGEFVAIMGPSGSGKSTLLSIMGALNTPSEGSYLVDGIDIYGLSRDRRADFRREYLGFIFQNFHLVPYLSVAENVMLPLTTKRISNRDKRDMAEEALAKVGLAGKGNRLPNQVSGGEQERAAIARAVVNEPPIILADEPTGNLDEHNSSEVMNLLSRLGKDGATVIMVTHDIDCAAYAQRMLKMSDGRLAETVKLPQRHAA